MSALSEADLAACRHLLRRGSASFSTASLLLPRRARDSATVLYAFCRVADDLVDEGAGATAPVVDALRERVTRAYAGDPEPDPVDRAFAAVVARDRIPIALPIALLEGLSWDASSRRYETIDALYAYAARVAGTVGAMITVLLGERAPTVLARACDLGVAMQLTNIARDVGEDARRGRIYLPLEWMRAEGLDPDRWLSSPTPAPGIRAVVERLLRQAEELYAAADVGIPALPARSRVAIRAARLIYADIGRSIARADFDSVTRRAFVSRPRKFWLLLRALAPRLRSPTPDGAPPLEPARFLVSACADLHA